MLVKVSDKTNDFIKEGIEEFPYFTIKCRISKVLKDRGMTLKELSHLTGIRMATLSELDNMKRTTIGVPHLVVIAKELRIYDMNELFEFAITSEDKAKFDSDRKLIDLHGTLPHQDEMLFEMRKQKEEKRAERLRINAIKRKARLEERKRKLEEQKRLEKERKLLEEQQRLALEQEENPTTD